MTDVSLLVDKGYKQMDFRELGDAPVSAIQGLSVDDAEKLKDAFGVETIRELAEHKFVRIALAITALAASLPAPHEVDQAQKAAPRAPEVFARALELFDGDPGAATSWLSSPKPALGGAVPFELAESDAGALEVERLIGRLEHGVFS